MAKALLINAEDGTVSVVQTPSENALPFLQEAVGGYIDCVRSDEFIGYVNDEGLLIGLPLNTLASVLFSRYLVGNVVIVGAYNDKGEYDGDDHDIPAWMEEVVKEYTTA